MPIGFATENHETLLDVDHIIHALQRKHSEVNYIQMPCVNDRQEFLEMAAAWADSHIAELLSEQAVSVNPAMAVAHTPGHHHHDHDGGHHHHH